MWRFPLDGGGLPMTAEAADVRTEFVAMHEQGAALMEDSHSAPSVVSDLSIWVERPAGFYVKIKPLLDALFAFILIILTLPILLVASFLVVCSAGLPVIFRQHRVGRDGKLFTVYKLRSMRADRRTLSRPVVNDRRIYHKSDDDPRHTSIGRFLRRSSLDELPQLFNVLKGDMSLVGPRPELPVIVDKYEPWQHQRHYVAPGLTGPWQTTARGDGPMHLRTDIDVAYVRDISLMHDLRVLLETIPALLSSRRGS
jgi:lipopolysaccharide/colanic/teichoic acid biosynthesis glycosyltransferase